MTDRAQKIRELERELAELKGEEPRPLTPARIRAMPREEVEEHWERVRATIFAERDVAKPRPRPSE